MKKTTLLLLIICAYNISTFRDILGSPNIWVTKLLAQENVPLPGYSLDPLQKPVFTQAETLIGTMRFNDWLIGNYQNINQRNFWYYREQLYYLISSHVSAIYENDRLVMPDRDKILELLFYWTELLGVYGGSLVYNQIKEAEREPMKPMLDIPASMELSLEGDLFRVGSKNGGWSVRFPYYFMISILDQKITDSGTKLEQMMVSTGSTRDESPLGYSQATLFLTYSPTGNMEDFATSITGYRNLGETAEAQGETRELNVKGLRSRYVFLQDSELHTELVFWQAETGLYFVIFQGKNGTYQVNHPHFLNFLEQLNVPGKIRPYILGDL